MTRLLVAGALALACVAAAAPARAQMAHVPESDWRQSDRHDAVIAATKAPLFYAELRFGTYQPGIDANLKTQPYASIFGECTTGKGITSCSASPLFHFGLELDAVPIRIPYVGGFGLGVGWGFSRASATAKFTTTKELSGETTALMIMPMHASLVLRADELMRRTGVPIVPYGKFGFGFAFWRASNDVGTEVYKGAMENVNGAGFTPGLHFAVGGMIALNFIEPRAAARLDETTGVHHAYAFGEYYNDRLVFSPDKVMHVGTSSWVAGLAVDF